jgi:hypothetical protein
MGKPLVFTVTLPGLVVSHFRDTLNPERPATCTIVAHHAEDVVPRRKMIVAALNVLRACTPDELRFADAVLTERPFDPRAYLKESING